MARIWRSIGVQEGLQVCLWLSIFALVSGGASGQDGSASSQNVAMALKDRGVEQYQQGDLAGAFESFEEALEHFALADRGSGFDRDRESVRCPPPKALRPPSPLMSGTAI